MGTDPLKDDPAIPPEPERGRRKRRQPQTSSWRWVIRIVGWTFVISMSLTLVSGSLIPRMNTAFALLVLLFFIALGVFFDILGLSVAIASPKPFHSMAARRVNGAAQSLRLLKNPEKIISFCSDVAGDIAGIVSGATASVIVARLIHDTSFFAIVSQALLFAVVSSLTIAGKAWGKTVTLKHNLAVVTQMGRVMFRAEALRNKIFPKSRGKL